MVATIENAELVQASERVRAQRALVVDLARSRQFDHLPAAHQVLRQMEDALKLARHGVPPST